VTTVGLHAVEIATPSPPTERDHVHRRQDGIAAGGWEARQWGSFAEQGSWWRRGWGRRGRRFNRAVTDRLRGSHAHGTVGRRL